jgi:hypothetical protein
LSRRLLRRRGGRWSWRSGRRRRRAVPRHLVCSQAETREAVGPHETAQDWRLEDGTPDGSLDVGIRRFGVVDNLADAVDPVGIVQVVLGRTGLARIRVTVEILSPILPPPSQRRLPRLFCKLPVRLAHPLRVRLPCRLDPAQLVVISLRDGDALPRRLRLVGNLLVRQLVLLQPCPPRLRIQMSPSERPSRATGDGRADLALHARDDLAVKLHSRGMRVVVRAESDEEGGSRRAADTQEEREVFRVAPVEEVREEERRDSRREIVAQEEEEMRLELGGDWFVGLRQAERGRCGRRLGRIGRWRAGRREFDRDGRYGRRRRNL